MAFEMNLIVGDCGIAAGSFSELRHFKLSAERIMKMKVLYAPVNSDGEWMKVYKYAVQTEFERFSINWEEYEGECPF
jgi:hypothetical protein